MTRIRLHPYLALCGLVLALAGCRSLAPEVRQVTAKCRSVTFEGCGLRAKEVPVTAERRTLRDAFASVSVEPVLNAGGYPVMLFARFVRPDADYFFATELIPNTAVGDMLLNPGEVIEIVPWTKTDLMRGLNEVAPPTATPAPAYAGSLVPLFTWYDSLPKRDAVLPIDRENFNKAQDDVARATLLSDLVGGISGVDPPATLGEVSAWVPHFERAALRKTLQRPALVFQTDQVYLQSLYGRRLAEKKEVPLDVTVADETPARKSTVFRPTITADKLKKSSGPSSPPRVGDATLVPATEDEAVLVVQRLIDERLHTFVMPVLKEKNEKVNPNTPIRWDVRENALIFDGDNFIITPPATLPVIQASEAVNRVILQPMSQRRIRPDRGGWFR